MHASLPVNLEDLRYFLALARHGRLVVAAERLGVEHTTVSRRIQALEKSLGQRLFERTTRGWDLAEAGRRLLPYAERIEDAAAEAVTAATGEVQPASGVVRLVATDGFGSAVIAPMLAPLSAANPDISLELVTTSQVLNNRIGDFDIALTLHRPDLPRFHVRKLCDYALRLYAAPSYLAANAPITRQADLAAHRLVWYIDSLIGLPELRTISELVDGQNHSFRSSNIFAQLEAVAAGIGVGLLPCFMAAHDPRLVEVIPEAVDVRRTFWIVVSSSLARVRRVQIVHSHLLEHIPALRHRLIPGGGAARKR